MEPALFFTILSPITQEWCRLVSCSVFPRAFGLPLGGPLSLPSVRLNSLMVILIISVWGCFQLPPDLQKAKNRKLFFSFLEYIFCQRAVSVDRKVIVKHILEADLHAKHKFEPGSHVRQLLHQQNRVLWLNVMVTGFESQRLFGLLNINREVKTTQQYPMNFVTLARRFFFFFNSNI